MTSNTTITYEGRPDQPRGTPLIRTLTLPADGNINGGIFGGWVLAELDKAAGLIGMRRSGGACSTVAIETLSFRSPLRVGEDFAIYGSVVATGRTSMRFDLQGWAGDPAGGATRLIVKGLFVAVALDAAGRPRLVPD